MGTACWATARSTNTCVRSEHWPLSEEPSVRADDICSHHKAMLSGVGSRSCMDIWVYVCICCFSRPQTTGVGGGQQACSPDRTHLGVEAGGYVAAARARGTAAPAEALKPPHWVSPGSSCTAQRHSTQRCLVVLLCTRSMSWYGYDQAIATHSVTDA